jgi:hypothetical protein
MQWYYDGQIRRYVGQIVRIFSGFKYQGLDGKQFTVPVAYGDLTRQVGNIIRDNSENKIPSAPRIAVYITDLQLDRTRLADATHVSKVHIREREKLYDSGGDFTGYGPTQGNAYTVERLMPTPYKLSVKVDIWSTNTDQKLQILEQIMMLFNPSLELQTTDNYIDWTSISVLEISNIQFSGRSIPTGIDSDIDIATLTLESPIFISPPTKVKRLGVIQDIIMNIKDESLSFEVQEKITVGGFDIFVYYNKDTGQYLADLIDSKTIIQSLDDTTITAWKKIGGDLNWALLLNQYPGKFKAGSSQVFLVQPDGNQIVGSVAINPLDETKLIINFDQDTYNTNSVIAGRTNIDAIIDPETFNPGVPINNVRYLILNDIAGPINRTHLVNDVSTPGVAAWGAFKASANDIIEWDGTQWVIVFDASEQDDSTFFTTNLRTGVQYRFDNNEWTRAFEGEYQKGSWRLVL